MHKLCMMSIWLTCMVIVASNCGCRESPEAEVIVNGSGDKATVGWKWAATKRPRAVKELSPEGTLTSITETRSGQKYIGISRELKGQNVKVIARVDAAREGLEILVDCSIRTVIRAKYERSDGTIRTWTRQVEPGKHVIRLPEVTGTMK